MLRDLHMEMFFSFLNFMQQQSKYKYHPELRFTDSKAQKTTW